MRVRKVRILEGSKDQGAPSNVLKPACLLFHLLLSTNNVIHKIVRLCIQDTCPLEVAGQASRRILI